MTDAVIDLDRLHDPSDEHPEPGIRRFRKPRLPFLAVSILLLVLLGGSARLPAERVPTIVAVRVGESIYLDPHRLHVVSPPSAASRVVTTYSLPGGELLARTPIGDIGQLGIVSLVASAGDTLLVSYQPVYPDPPTTVGIRLGAAQPSWEVPAQLVSASADAGLGLLGSGDYRDWSAVDLATGKLRWSLGTPEDGDLTRLGNGFPRRMVTAAPDGHVELHDGVSGALLRAVDLPADPAWNQQGITVWAGDEAMLIEGEGGLTAYGMNDLTARWTVPIDLTDDSYVEPDCAGSICVFGLADGLKALDPATGAVRWSSDRWSTATAIGSALMVRGTEVGDAVPGRFPLAVVDPATGKVLADYGRWQPYGPVRPDGTVVVLRQVGTVVNYGLLDPAVPALRLLGTATGISGDCNATIDFLVCRRLDASVAIWDIR
ncbi:hypothetical protein GCM10010435_09800 [Winogradskya consettensis]|uniref:Outer membrane protein assembly factor BamB n=1 Tax=Winogradskya consettensis TaxID=113560 RepID=A0A919SXT5_9ACTN|nr:hypothetical protein [Actinoplanes consettensis]GIM80760.1 hypothetical protein Aco04nite_72520 [Actinoplanes consettensis]